MRISAWSSDVCPSDLTRDAPAQRIVCKLILADPRDAEIAGFRMREVKARHGRGGQHRKALGQRDFGRLGRIQQVEQHRLQAMQNGRASRRERVCTNVSNSVVDVSLTKKETIMN